LPESLLARRLRLGRFFGIGLYVHWSFALLVLYVLLSTREDGPAMMAFATAHLFGIFLCVTLHEYGHALAARGFGIDTADITLLPIGGVARLQRMPRIPWQELVIAVAGPAVNVVIAIVLLIGFVALADRSVISDLGSALAADSMDEETSQRLGSLFSTPSLMGFVILMMAVNVLLVLFNLIPAFPMDGGRVFRSLLAMVMDYRRATWTASRVGVVCAVLMAITALTLDPGNPIPVLIAVFIGYAGISEARHVEVSELVRGLTVGQVMAQTTLSLSMDTPLSEILARWRNLAVPALPVLSGVGSVVGMLSLREVASAIERGLPPSTTAGQLVDHESAAEPVRVSEPLDEALMRLRKQQRQIAVVDESGQLVGILDVDTMMVRRALFAGGRAVEFAPDTQRFDQVT
jgi:Zn-dependent protease/predicted transcriptional regulator